MQSFKQFLNEGRGTSFKQYINERELPSYEEQIEKIVDNCSEFIKDIKGKVDDVQLFRGITGKRLELEFNNIRKDRKSKDTPKNIHEKVDKYFEETFGIPLRSASVQCSNSAAQAFSYGSLHYIFPVNGYEMFWGDEIRDFTVWFNNEKESMLNAMMDEPEEYSDILPGTEDGNIDIPEIESWYDNPPQWLVNDIMNLANWEGDINVLASNDEIEIMLVGDGYYGLPDDHPDKREILERIKEVAKEKGII